MEFLGKVINPMLESGVFAPGKNRYEIVFRRGVIWRRLAMRENRGPRDVCGVEDGLDIESDGVEIFIVQNGSNNFIGKFF